jgi:hemolysin D
MKSVEQETVLAVPAGSDRAAGFRNALSFLGAADSGRNYEREFLPAAIEIAETPPSPTGRAFSFVIIAIFTACVLWALIGKVDIVAVATGKIIPSGRVKIVQPFEAGVVRAIHVRDGQRVRAGEVLIELDPTITQAEVDHLTGDILAAKLDVARLRAALSGVADPLTAFHPPAAATSDMLETSKRLLLSQLSEQAAKLSTLDRQQAEKDAELATVDATIKKLEATIPILQERVDVRKTLYDKELGSKLLYLADLQELVGLKKDLAVQHSRYHEAQATIAALVESRQKTEAEYRRALLDDLAKAEQKTAGLAQDLVKANERSKLQRLTAPVDGTVQQLGVHTVGGVVNAAQPLLVVVPLDSKPEIEAMVLNRDIGFVHEGQVAAIKVDTFNFTRYGLVHGKVVSVSSDAIPRDTSRGGDRSVGAVSASSEPKGQELVYAARISLDRAQMDVDDKRVNLSPGMAVTVEIKTGSRTIMSYLLSPVFKYAHESLHER